MALPTSTVRRAASSAVHRAARVGVGATVDDTKTIPPLHLAWTSNEVLTVARA